MLSISFYCRLSKHTPAKGCRYCEIHKDVAKEYVNDEIGIGHIALKPSENTGLLIVKVLNEKSTRQGKMFEVIVVIFLLWLLFIVVRRSKERIVWKK